MPRLFLRCAIEEKVEKFVLRRADFVLAQNDENLNSAIAYGARSDRSALTELGVGIDAAHFLPPELRKSASLEFKEWECSGKTILICVSRLEKLKMVDHAVLSVKRLKEMKIPFKLIIVGTGREEWFLKELARENSLQDEIVFAGQRSQDWISSALAMSDIFVSPLCGRALLEAGLAGIPAVGYDVDWHNQIITQNTGFLVENLNLPKLSEEVCKLSLQKDLALKLGSNMRIHALSLANPNSIAQRQREIYALLIES
jgi:glycosyltransferase involved in cell wall biosynthesis